MDERARLELVRRVLEGPAGHPHPGPGTTSDGRDSPVVLGIGDDGAILALGTEQLVCSVDVVVEGTHFRRAWLGLDDLGYKATMAALSDLAAMGAEPLGVLSSLVLAADIDDAALELLLNGQKLACAEMGTSIVGGNLARGEALVISTTVLGHTAQPMRRSGARAGDTLWLAGQVGLAAAGLAALAGGEHGPRHPDLAPALAAWRRPRALVAEGVRAAAVASAAIDVSDGLSLDAYRLAEASDVSVVLLAEPLVSEQLTAAARAAGADPLELALSGGEDYALLVAAAPGHTLPGFRVVGRVERAAERRLWLESNGQALPIEPRGFDHFG